MNTLLLAQSDQPLHQQDISVSEGRGRQWAGSVRPALPLYAKIVYTKFVYGVHRWTAPHPGLCSGSHRLARRFEQWAAALAEAERALARFPDEDDPVRERLLAQMSALERKILTTECHELPAVRAKAHLLQWLMEMEQADGLPAIKHITAYLDAQS